MTAPCSNVIPPIPCPIWLHMNEGPFKVEYFQKCTLYNDWIHILLDYEHPAQLILTQARDILIMPFINVLNPLKMNLERQNLQKISVDIALLWSELLILRSQELLFLGAFLERFSGSYQKISHMYAPRTPPQGSWGEGS